LNNKEHICVVGLGYIGLPTAIMFAKQGYTVTGVDVKSEVVDTLRKGELHIHEDGLAVAFKGALAMGGLTFSEQTVAADVFIIAVPTPFNKDKSADMRYVRSAAEGIRPVLKAGDLVVLESTSPPRTTIELVQPILEQGGLKAGKDFDLAYSPERVLPGRILEELVSNDRIVGGLTEQANQRAKVLYASFVRGTIHCTDPTTAEMVKLMENTYRDVNIALANEFSRIAAEQAVDVWEAIELANHHPRVEILRPGAGVGGHCISVDPWFLVEVSPERSDLIRTARRVNDAQPAFLVSELERAIGPLAGVKAAVLGLAYKPNIDDLRESPAIEVVHLLRNAGCEVRTFEPYVPDHIAAEGVMACETLPEAVKGVEVVLVVVAHDEFKALTAAKLAELVGKPGEAGFTVVDAVNILPREQDGECRVVRLGVGK
jgi:UDP-N-acetyl-D-mannosaminuronic acid dehydrogenase